MKTRGRKLSTYDLVHMTNHDLQELGIDPTWRVGLTAQQHPIPDVWLPALGRWGGLETHEMIVPADTRSALVAVSESAYRKYKSRHRLLCGRQFANVYGSEPWARAELCERAVREAQAKIVAMSGTAGPPGVAAEYAHAIALRNGRRLGLMPVEIMVWSAVFDAFLKHWALSIDEWSMIRASDRHDLWVADGRSALDRFDEVLHAQRIAPYLVGCSA